MKKLLLALLSVILMFLTIGCAQDGSTDVSDASPTSPPTEVSTAAPEHSGPSFQIPYGSPSQIDGTIDPGEWEDALATSMSDGSTLYLKYVEDGLYAAVEAAVPSTVNIGILRDGELWILHSSAALGSAVYEKQTEGWEMEKNFSWCCRISAPEWQYEELLETEGWLSHNQYAGEETHTEYRIVIPAEDIILSVTLLYRDQSGTAFWPGGLAETDLLRFSTPPQVGDLAIFTEVDWARLVISD